MENLNVIEFHQSRDFSQKMSVTFEFIRQNFKALSKCLIYIAGPPVLLSSYFIGDVYGSLLNLSTTGVSSTTFLEDQFATAEFFLKILGIIFFAFLAGISILSVVFNYLLEYEAKRTNKIEVNDVWSRVLNTFGNYLGTVILYIVLLIVLYIIVVIPSAIFIAFSPFLGFFVAMAVGIGFLYAVIALSLLFPIRAFEKISFVDAVRRSFYLIQGKWWSTFGLYFVMSIIVSTLSVIFLIPMYVTIFVNAMHAIDNNAFVEPTTSTSLFLTISFALYFMASFLLQALPLIGGGFQYFNLVERKEAKGLLSRIETFGQEAPPTNPDEQY